MASLQEFTLARFEGTFRTRFEAVPGVEPLTLDDLPAVYDLDEAVTKTQRAKLLRYLYDAAPDMMRKCVHDGRLEGYCLVRPGANAWQIGPIHGTVRAGTRLLLDAASRFAGKSVYLDVPTDHTAAAALVESLGLRVQRPLLRMGRGPRLHEDLTRFWSGSGPEKG